MFIKRFSVYPENQMKPIKRRRVICRVMNIKVGDRSMHTYHCPVNFKIKSLCFLSNELLIYKL